MYLRRPQSPNSVVDPIGLAAELLRPDSIARAIAPLDRDTLRVLAEHDWTVSGTVTAKLTRLGLVGAGPSAADARKDEPIEPSPVALPEVDVALQAALTSAGFALDGLGSDLPGLPNFPGLPLTSEQPIDPKPGAWFTPALTSVGEAAECLRALQRAGLRLNRSGVLGVSATRELAERASITPAAVSHALRQLDRAGLTTIAGSQLIAAEQAATWLALPHQARWLELARAFLAHLPTPLRDSLAAYARDAAPQLPEGTPLPLAIQLGRAGEELSDRFPLLPEVDLALAREFVSDAEHLGCTAHGHLTPIAQQLLAGSEVTVADVTAQLPAAATGVYLQPDLTVLAPGPLDPAAEAALAELSRPEQIGPASMRRITEAALAGAFERGLTPAAARETLEQLSMTGVPQPLDYLLSSVADRIGRIVVHEHSGLEGRSRIRIAHPSLAQTAIVDRQLQHLQLTCATDDQLLTADVLETSSVTAGASVSVPDPAAPRETAVVLFSRLRAEHVVTAFNEARYHASLGGDIDSGRDLASGTDVDFGSGINADGNASLPDTAARLETAAMPAASEPVTAAIDTRVSGATSDPLRGLIERVFVAARTEPEAAAHTRRLELAIRDKALVSVTAESRGQRRTFTLLPVALTDGRLRATDGSAGVERTLPVSMIVSVDPA